MLSDILQHLFQILYRSGFFPAFPDLSCKQVILICNCDQLQHLCLDIQIEHIFLFFHLPEHLFNLFITGTQFLKCRIPALAQNRHPKLSFCKRAKHLRLRRIISFKAQDINRKHNRTFYTILFQDQCMQFFRMDAHKCRCMNLILFCIYPYREITFLKIDPFHFLMPMRNHMPLIFSVPFVQSNRILHRSMCSILF